jgi:hypothetical protein
MLDATKLAVSIIAILAIGGAISFVLAYSFYPEKHENVTVDGKCYELLGAAHEQYVKLAAKKDIETLKLQLSKVEPTDAIIPIIFSGRNSDIEHFRHSYQLTETSRQKVKYYPNIDASLVTANISKQELQNIAGNLTLKDAYPSAKTVAGSIGIEPNKLITSAEGRDISIKSNEFMSSGIRQIIANSDGAKSAYCRTGVTN